MQHILRLSADRVAVNRFLETRHDSVLQGLSIGWDHRFQRSGDLALSPEIVLSMRLQHQNCDTLVCRSIDATFRGVKNLCIDLHDFKEIDWTINWIRIEHPNTPEAEFTLSLAWNYFSADRWIELSFDLFTFDSADFTESVVDV